MTRQTHLNISLFKALLSYLIIRDTNTTSVDTQVFKLFTEMCVCRVTSMLLCCSRTKSHLLHHLNYNKMLPVNIKLHIEYWTTVALRIGA